MSQRPSLMDQAGIPDAAPSGGGPSGGGMDPQKIKLIAAIVLVVVAGVVVAWTTGLIGGGEPKVDQAEVEARQQRLEEEVKADAVKSKKTPVPAVEAGG